jgi:hypothetical protein
MSAIVATQRIVGGKISGDGKNDTLSQRDLDLICQLLDIENPDSLPTGEKCRYLLTLETIEAIPKKVRSPAKLPKKRRPSKKR